jgi:FkbM family methyltransferase
MHTHSSAGDSGGMLAWVRGRCEILERTYRHPLNRGSKARALRDYFVWNAARFSLDAQFVLNLPENLKIIVGREENYGTSVYVHSLHDFDEMLFLAHVLRTEDTFADIGANVGLYSVWVSGATGATSVAVEPVPKTYELLRQNVRLNDLCQKIETWPVAVAEEPGEVAMDVGSSGTNHVVFAPRHDTVSILSDTLERILGGTVPYAMKIDVEGFELRVLRGAVKTMKECGLHVIVIELQDVTLLKYGANMREVRTFIEEFGFRAYAYDPRKRMLSEMPAGHKSSYDSNVIFARDLDDIRGRLASGRKIISPLFPDGI